MPPKAPPSASSFVATTGIAGALTVIIQQALWAIWGIELTNETTTAIMTLLPAVAHASYRCVWCQRFFGISTGEAAPAPPSQQSTSSTQTA